MEQETVVVIVGAGPAGLATSACLNLKNIPNIVLEMEDCIASLWKKHSYDRLELHLAKEFCQLPHMPFPPNTPTFVSKIGFIQYLENYVSHFKINPFCNRLVESASVDVDDGKWLVQAKHIPSGITETYAAEFLVVATSENSEGFIPDIVGLEKFGGQVMHSRQYENGKKFYNKEVLVVGSGNSGMEIAYDLSNSGAKPSIVVRSPVHVLTRDIVRLGMVLLKFIPCSIVDKIVVMLGNLMIGDLSYYGIQRPSEGPFYLKATTGRSPVIDVGTVKKIREGEIMILPAMEKADEDGVQFANGGKKNFDAIVFATGYRSTVRKWLKDDDSLFNEHGMPKKPKPDHWKGDNGLYCAGFSSSGLFGIANDAMKIAEDISHSYFKTGKEH